MVMRVSRGFPRNGAYTARTPRQKCRLAGDIFAGPVNAFPCAHAFDFGAGAAVESRPVSVRTSRWFPAIAVAALTAVLVLVGFVPMNEGFWEWITVGTVVFALAAAACGILAVRRAERRRRRAEAEKLREARETAEGLGPLNAPKGSLRVRAPNLRQWRHMPWRSGDLGD